MSTRSTWKVGVGGNHISLTQRDPIAGHVRHQSPLNRVPKDLTSVRIGVSVAGSSVHLSLDEYRVGTRCVYKIRAGAGHGDVALRPSTLQRGLAVNTVTVPLLQLWGRGSHVSQHLPAGAGRGGGWRQGSLRGQQGLSVLWSDRSGVMRGRSLALISPNINQVSAADTSLTAQTRLGGPAGGDNRKFSGRFLGEELLCSLCPDHI